MQPGDTPRTIDDAELAGWAELELSCDGCRQLSYLPFDHLRKRTRHRVLADIRARLVCRRCGRKPARIWLHRTVSTHFGGPESRTLEI